MHSFVRTYIASKLVYSYMYMHVNIGPPLCVCVRVCVCVCVCSCADLSQFLAQLRDLSLCRLLLDFRADPEQHNASGATARSVASRQGPPKFRLYP